MNIFGYRLSLLLAARTRIYHLRTGLPSRQCSSRSKHAIGLQTCSSNGSVPKIYPRSLAENGGGRFVDWTAWRASGSPRRPSWATSTRSLRSIRRRRTSLLERWITSSLLWCVHAPSRTTDDSHPPPVLRARRRLFLGLNQFSHSSFLIRISLSC